MPVIDYKCKNQIINSTKFNKITSIKLSHTSAGNLQLMHILDIFCTIYFKHRTYNDDGELSVISIGSMGD